MNGLVRVSDIDRGIENAFPPEWAEGWDRVGLACGDPDRTVTGVLVTLDPTPAAIARAGHVGANVVVSHHPVALKPPERLVPGPGPAGALFSALDARIALIAAHTNLDRAPAGVRALPLALGLVPVEPVERASQPMSRVTVYAPPEALEAILGALSDAGAGRIAAYESASFVADGVGRFRPRADAHPAVGRVGVVAAVDEVRVESTCPRGAAARVAASVRAVHPYEEPLMVIEDVEIARASARMGMRCAPQDGLTLEALARRVRTSLGVSPRVWGREPDALCGITVTATGSAGSLIPDALAAGANTLVCGEVRYHDALDAVGAGLTVVEMGHDVSEWPLVPILAQAVLATPGLDSALVHVDSARAAWWTPDGS